MKSLLSPLIRAAKGLVPGHVKHRMRQFRWPLGSVGTLPGSSRWFGPARRWVKATDYFRWNAGSIREVLPAQKMPAPVFRPCGPIPARFFERFQPDIPRGYILQLPEARLIGPDGWIIGARDSYLTDASYWAYPDAQMDLQDHYMLIPQLRRPAKRLAGRTFSLASDFAIGGFGHFLHDSLTRLLLVEKAGIDLREYDWIYWPHLDTPLVKALVRAANLPAEKVLNCDRTHDLVCESLTATSFPGRPGQIAPVYADFLRRRFAPAPTGAKRKLYLSRRGFRRNFRNAKAIEAVLHKLGYEECLAHEDNAVFAKCADASHVVAIEGASFFNAFACPKGTKVLLILPDAGPTMPYTLTLGLSAGFEMFLLAAQSLDQPRVDPGIADIHLDPAELAGVLTQMEA